MATILPKLKGVAKIERKGKLSLETNSAWCGSGGFARRPRKITVPGASIGRNLCRLGYKTLFARVCRFGIAAYENGNLETIGKDVIQPETGRLTRAACSTSCRTRPTGSSHSIRQSPSRLRATWLTSIPKIVLSKRAECNDLLFCSGPGVVDFPVGLGG